MQACLSDYFWLCKTWESTNPDACFVASSPDNAENNLHYTFSFDRTDKFDAIFITAP